MTEPNRQTDTVLVFPFKVADQNGAAAAETYQVIHPAQYDIGYMMMEGGCVLL
jgi:hypothetical protein